MNTGISFVCWIIAVSLNGWLLLSVAGRLAAPTLLKRACLAFAITLSFWLLSSSEVAAIGIAPSDDFGDRLFQSFFTIEIVAMLSIGNAIFQGMVDGVIAFHRRVNAANLDRFPVSFLIHHQRKLKLFGTLAWCAGGSDALRRVVRHACLSC